MRFLADENVSHCVLEQLRTAGFDVAAISLTNPGAPDSDVLATARRDGRILITEDRDFGELIVRQRFEIQGVVLLELDRLSNAAEADRVAAVPACGMSEPRPKSPAGSAVCRWAIPAT